MTTKDNWLTWAVRLQALAQNGLAYTDNAFDKERFEEIRQIAAEMLVEPSGQPLEVVEDLFVNETGYQTPKLDTRAAIFQEDKILLVQESDGRWSLPGGWCDVFQSPMDNTVKEAKEEAGLDVVAYRLVAVLDKHKHQPSRSAHHVTKMFFLCKNLGGQFVANTETLDSQYFALNELPELSINKTSEDQIALCYEAYKAEQWEAVFD
ncbi:NUDIX hydrolase N-terminal domain-containing protein [Streptococcus caprae]|uniref:NUDIX hydrolase N-terminal domain-containing protein n=1 Tax=Streptococcus caprae TaxID=1640501 RepID=A0ABV8CW85_9STRE